MLLKEMNMRTIAMYNEMISYYHTHMGKVSKYGNMRITEKMLFNLVIEELNYQRGIKING